MMLACLRRKAREIVPGLLALLLLPVGGIASNNLAEINGRVRDSSGASVTGAFIVIAASSPRIPERMTFSDSRGAFSVPNLFAGEYSIKVTMPQFLPAFKNGIHLNAGGNAVLTVNMQNALDVVRRALSRKPEQSDDIVWTLRSSRASQPVLRLMEQNLETSASKASVTDYSGYFQVYSKSVESFGGTSEGVGSEFSVTMPLDTGSQVTVAGQYSELPEQSRGVGALYEFKPNDRHHSTVGVHVRQGALAGDPLAPGTLQEIQVEYSEDFQWSDHFVINYGTEIGRTDAIADRSYLRPRLGVTWVPQARTTVSVLGSSQAPSALDDPIRGKDYFGRTTLLPPRMERYSHSEIAGSHIISDNVELSAAVFRDRVYTQALLVTAPGGRRSLLIMDTSRNPSNGIRVHLNGRVRGLEAGLGYTAASGMALADVPEKMDDLNNALVPRRFQIVTARLKTDVSVTRTELVAVYRWMSNFSASDVDPYQTAVEYNDPTLSITIAQDLPTSRLFRGKVQAILDARNVFEHSFGPQGIQVAQYPRLVKGGINIKF
jgi:hypothetical protein